LHDPIRNGAVAVEIGGAITIEVTGTNDAPIFATPS
jgi:hypothetical protein